MTVCVEEPRDEDGRAPASLGMRLVGHQLVWR